MKKHFLFIFLSVLFYSTPSISQDWIKVKWINDGDTIVLADGRQIRYIGINAPEIDHKGQKAEPLGYRAKTFNQNLLFSKRVRLELDKEKKDQYGRWLAYVFLENDVLINQMMIAEGLAYVLPKHPNLRYSHVFLKAQRVAMTAKKGIWNNWKEKEGVYLGNQRSKRFHHETCVFGKSIKKANRRVFARKWDAFWAGYAPCKRCMSGNY